MTTVAPEIVPFDIGEGPANWGDTVTATCTVLKGDHPIQIEWALNGEPISRNHYDISIVNTSKRVSLLTIDGVTARHAGEYTCSVSNAAGGTSYSATLAVNGTPNDIPPLFSPLFNLALLFSHARNDLCSSLLLLLPISFDLVEEERSRRYFVVLVVNDPFSLSHSHSRSDREMDVHVHPGGKIDSH